MKVWDRRFFSRIYRKVLIVFSGGFSWDQALQLSFVYTGFMLNAIRQAFKINEKF